MSQDSAGQRIEAYTTEHIRVLKDACHIRHRPGMYIGDTGKNGLHHLVYELVHNCVDEALAGYCKNIIVTLGIDGSCTVGDDGRGIPVEMHPDFDISTLEAVMTMVGAGCRHMGLKAVTALSERLEAQVQRGGRTYRQEYERGKAVADVRDAGATDRTGTEIMFRPDPEIFPDIGPGFDFDTLAMRLRELAFLNKGLAIRLRDERTGADRTFAYAGGIADFVAERTADAQRLHERPIVERTVPVESQWGNEVRVEVAMQFTNADDERGFTYANNTHKPMGGTHLSGFRRALTRTLGEYGMKHDSFGKFQPIGEDFRQGLTFVISVHHPAPQFNGQLREKLGNTEVDGIVAGIVSECLSRFLDENPREARRIMQKVAFEAEFREREAVARRALRHDKQRRNVLR